MYRVQAIYLKLDMVPALRLKDEVLFNHQIHLSASKLLSYNYKIGFCCSNSILVSKLRYSVGIYVQIIHYILNSFHSNI